MNLKKEIENLENILNCIEPITNLTTYHEVKRIVETLKSVYRASPFHEGDIVELVKTPVINYTVSPGWVGAKHFLVCGAKAEVATVGWNDKTDNYNYALKFFGESYIDHHTKEEVLIENKSLYYFDVCYIDTAFRNREVVSPTMLARIKNGSKSIEDKIKDILDEESKLYNKLLHGKSIIYWEDEFTNGQYNQIKKQGVIENVLMEVDCYKDFFVNTGFKLTGGYVVWLEEVEEIK